MFRLNIISTLRSVFAPLSHTHDDKVDKVTGKGLSTNDYTSDEKTKLAGIATGANKTTVDSALSSSSTNPVQNSVINTALGNKVDKVSGKGLSTNDYTSDEKTKLAGIDTGANKTTVDSSLSSSSTNPVQNKVVNTALSGKANSSHNQASSTITEASALSNLGTSANATQATVNGAINTKIGAINNSISELQSIKAIEVVSTKPTASASTMNKLYLVSENSKVNAYYTVQSGSSYSLKKMDDDILDELSISWSDVTGKPSSFTPSSHTHGNITNDGKIGSTTGEIVVTNSGSLTTGNPSTAKIKEASALSNISSAANATQHDVNDKINTALGNKVDKVSGKGLSTNDYTSDEKTKLAGIDTGANAYSHPSYTARTGKPTANQTPGFGGTATVSQIKSDSTGHVTEANDFTIKIPNTVANGTTAGLSTNDYTTTEKTKLEGIATGANNYSHPDSGVTAGTNYNGNQTPSFGGTFNIPKLTFNAQGHITSSANSTVTVPSLPTASTSTVGIIKIGTTANDACAGNDSRLSNARTPTSHAHGNISNEGVISGATSKNVVTDANGKITTENKPTIPTGSSTATDIKMNGTQSAGSSSNFAKADHVHPTDTSRAASSHTHSYLPLSGGTLTGAVSSNSNITTSGTIQGATIKKTNGASNEILMADGSTKTLSTFIREAWENELFSNNSTTMSWRGLTFSFKVNKILGMGKLYCSGTISTAFSSGITTAGYQLAAYHPSWKVFMPISENMQYYISVDSTGGVNFINTKSTSTGTGDAVSGTLLFAFGDSWNTNIND